MKKTTLFFLSVSLLVSFSSFSQQVSPGACGNGLNNSKNPKPLDGSGSLGQVYNDTKCGLNFVAGSVLIEQRSAPWGFNTGGTGVPTAITIAGLAPCTAVDRAFLYYVASYQSGPPISPTIDLTNPQSVTATFTSTIIGTSGDKCWGEAGTCAYRTDVTSNITNNGVYGLNITGFGNPNWEIDGALLLIFYRDLSATYQGTIILDDGAMTCGAFNGYANPQSHTMGGFSACATSTASTAFALITDMQGNINGGAHNTMLNGVTASYPNSFFCYDQMATTINAGQTTCNFNADGFGMDCYMMVLDGLYYQTTSCVACTPQGLSVNQSSTPAPCGSTTGSITVTPVGGVGPYTYVWSPAVAGNTNTAGGLPAGSYQITVNDAVGCSSVVTVVVTGGGGPTTTTSTTATGCTTANGSATTNPTGGTPGYTYSWNTTPPQNTQTANNLGAGSYVVTITDANGCSTTDIITITTANGPATTSSVSSNALCFGASNGSATTNPTGGTPGYTYSWNTTPPQNTQTANNLGAGSYVVTITDANGCSTTDVVIISEPTVITLTSTNTPILCNGGTTGSATVNPTGGTPGYTYLWTTTPAQNTQTANNLGAGSYQCTVTDANGCTTITTVTLTQPAPLTAAVTSTNILCNGGNNGSATATMNGGSTPYTYAWSTTPPQNTQTANNLPPGSYNVTITDANGCTAQSSATITQPAPMVLTLSCGDSICAGDTTILSALVSGGSPTYTYVWLPVNQNSASISVSPATNTNYTVSVVDGNGCTSLSQTCNVVVLPAPVALFDTASTGQYGSLYSFNDLSAGGTSWLWLFGDNTTSSQQNPIHTFPGAGTYTVTQVVFNQYGCPDTFLLVVDINEGIIIPNVFTPDGNGHNDVWYIPNSGMKEFHVVIFDRWGAKVFETSADEIRWDGRSSSGKSLSDGTYYYVLHALLKSGATEKNYSTNGYVTLLTKNQK